MTDRAALVSATLLAALSTLVVPRLHAAVGEPPPIVASPPAPAEVADGVTLSLALDRSAVLAGQRETRFVTLELTMPDVEGAQRRPLDLVVVVDTSGSMVGDKIAGARRAVHHLVDALEPEDTFSLVGFESAARVLVPPTVAADRAWLHRQVDLLADGGGTNLYAGLELGLAQLHTPGAIPRLVLLSDGQTNEGVVDPAAIARRASLAFDHGVAVSAVGLGLDFNEDLLFAMSKAGGGSYHFVDEASALDAVFAEEVDRSSALAGRQAVVDLDLGPGVEAVEVLGWAAERTATGWRVALGDLPARATRRVVARVTVQAGQVGAFEAARATVRWLDRAERPQLAHAATTVEVTGSVARVEASLNPEVEGVASWVYANALSMRSASAYAAGDDEAAQALVDESREQLEKAVARKVKPAAERMRKLEEQAANQAAYAPGSAAGRRSVKEMKGLSALGYVE